MAKFKITWEIADGYAGKSRPQHTTFNTEDYLLSDEEWNELDQYEKEEYFQQAVQEDFESKISFEIENINEV